MDETNTPHVSLTADDNQVHYVKKKEPVLENGAYMMDINHKLYTESQWDALAVKPEAIGVALKTDNCKFVFNGKSLYEMKWSNNNSIVPNCCVAEAYEDAILDFNGVANSNAVLAAYPEENNVFKEADSLTDGGLKWCIPSYGELCELIENYYSEMNILCSEIGIMFDYDYYYIPTSTQKDASSVYAYRGVYKSEKPDYASKNSIENYVVIAHF